MRNSTEHVDQFQCNQGQASALFLELLRLPRDKFLTCSRVKVRIVTHSDELTSSGMDLPAILCKELRNLVLFLFPVKMQRADFHAESVDHF